MTWPAPSPRFAIARPESRRLPAGLLSRMQAIAVVAVLSMAACASERAANSSGEDSTAGGAPASDSATVDEPRAACDRAPDRDDHTICLPDRVGPLMPSTSRNELAALYPDASLRDETVDAGEGTMTAGTIVNAGRDDEVTILWADSSRSNIVALQALGPAWRTPEGLGAGSTLDEVEAALGTVDVLGFGWDYGGTILLDRTSLEGSGLFLRTQPGDSTMRGSAAWQRVRGDRPFRSDDPDVESLELVVRRVDIRFQ